jgi:general stress protein CsbA
MLKIPANVDRQAILWPYVATAITGVLIFACYWPAIVGKALLDEQFIMHWLHDGLKSHEILAQFLTWKGPDENDRWWLLAQPLMIAIYRLGDGTIFAFRLGGPLFHWHASVIAFLIARELTHDLWERKMPLLAMAACVLFATFPLAAEAVSWVGGRPIILGATGFLLSFYAYIKSRLYEEDRIPTFWIAILAYLGFQLVCAGSWLFFFVYLAYECFYGPKGEAGDEEDGPNRQLSRGQALAPLAIISLGALFAQYILLAKSCALMQWPDLAKMLSAMVFPIDHMLFTDITREKWILAGFYLAPLLVLAAGLSKDRARLKLAAFCLVWLLVSAVPYASFAIDGTTLYGSRWTYLAAVPFSILAASALTSFRIFVRKRLPVALTLSLAFTSLVTFFYCRQTSAENICWRTSAEALYELQERVKRQCRNENLPYKESAGVPSRATIAPIISSGDRVLFDGKTGLIRAPRVDWPDESDLPAHLEFAHTNFDSIAYSHLCYSYPNDQNFGLCVLPFGSPGFRLVADSSYADLIAVHILKQGRLIKNFLLTNAPVTANDFPGSGIYQIRLCQTTNQSAHYSRSFYCLVDTFRKADIKTLPEENR